MSACGLAAQARTRLEGASFSVLIAGLRMRSPRPRDLRRFFDDHASADLAAVIPFGRCSLPPLDAGRPCQPSDCVVLGVFFE